MKSSVLTICLTLGLRLCVGAVFAYSGIAKLQNPLMFLDAIYNFQLFDPNAGFIGALILPWIELFTGLTLLTGTLTRAAFALAAVLSAAFVIIQSIGVQKGLDIDCGCFGSSAGNQQHIGTASITRVSLLLFASTWGFFLRRLSERGSK